MIRKIISGGQTGADQGGLEAGKLLGLETGGTAPKGWITEKGPMKELLQSYRLEEGEHDLKIYPKRTYQNVRNSDGTLLIGNTSSPGTTLTKKYCKTLLRPFKENPSLDELKEWIKNNFTLRKIK